jgi:cephalosporin hydroxylase
MQEEDVAAIQRVVNIYERSGAAADTAWLGRAVARPPTDLWEYQEIIWETEPAIILVSGGEGLAYYFATLADVMLLDTHVVQIGPDLASPPDPPDHPRVVRVPGKSVSADTFRAVRAATAALPDRTMVVLSSGGAFAAVMEEVRVYRELVTPSDYFVIDSRLSPGSAEAVRLFSECDERFERDVTREKQPALVCRRRVVQAPPRL